MNRVSQVAVLVTLVAGVMGVARPVAAQRDTAAAAGGQVRVRLGGYGQIDGRFFPGDNPTVGLSNVFVRRARLITEVTGWKYFTMRLAPDFGQGRVVLFDAYMDIRFLPQIALRIGKTKPPIGLERLQAAIDMRFVERGLPTNLVPTRDEGIELFGDIGGGTLSYAVGVFDGAPDLISLDLDTGNDKDVVARLFAQPFRNREVGALRGLGVGVGVSTGSEHGSVSAPSLAAYVTPGQQLMFRYRDSTVADGHRYRVAPQAYFHAGPIGLLAEYGVSAQELTRGPVAGSVRHTSWQVAGSWWVTGEKAAFTTVTPRRLFDPDAGHWGAVELAARYGELTLDELAFPTFANPATSARLARAWAVGATWHLARAVQLMVNYEQTTFTGGAAGGNREPEHFLVARVQQAF